MAEYQRTALYDFHVALGARMAPFGGWEMPIQYSGISKEHQAVRQGVGIFDVSHMGEFFVRGPRALDFLQQVTTNDVARLSDGGAQYTAMASEEGTAVDDLLVYRLASDHYMLVVNAANTNSDFQWLSAQNDFGVELEDVSDETALLAIQGPRAEESLQVLTDADLSGISSFSFVRTRVGGGHGILSRTGYTGEDGFEFYFPNRDAPSVWKALVDAGRSFGMLPAGLGARNTLRLEAGLLLYGSDMDRTTTLLEAGIGWVVKFDKTDFTGRDALLMQKEKGLTRKLVGFQMLGREIARDGYAVLVGGDPVGHVTSGGPSITLKKNVGLAYVRVEHAAHGTRLQVEIRKRVGDAEVVPTPFYKRRRLV